MPSTPPFSNPTPNKAYAVPPLDEKRFNESFEHFCSVTGLTLDPEPLHVGERKVDLYSLHGKIMDHRAYDINERGPSFWVKIGQELDIIRSQGVSSSDSEVANRLAEIYRQYLAQFDSIYVMSFVEEVKVRQGRKD